MEEIKEGERIHEEDRNKHTEDGDIVQIVNSIRRRRTAEGSLPVTDEQPCTIYQVCKVLRQANEKSYEPQIVSIGPYHRHNRELKPMEEKKFQCLLSLLSRNLGLKLEDFVKEIKDLEANARKCYSESISLHSKEFVEMIVLDGGKELEANARKCYSESISLQSKEFVEMMVLDGGFLVELLLPISTTKINDELCFSYFVTHDMLLLENQLPFFILQRIFSLVMPKESPGLMKDRLLDYFESVLPLNKAAAPKESYPHVLDMFHHHCLPTHRSEKNYADGGRSHNARCSKLASSLAYIDRLLRQLIRKCWPTEAGIFDCCVCSCCTITRRRLSIPSAEELQEAGIVFQRKEAKVAEPTGSFLDVEFDKKGALKIPFLYYSDNVQPIFQNLIAYEQCNPKVGTFFTGYAMFMDDLISTAKDVQILCRAGIIEHGLGSNDEVAQSFNELCRQIFYDSKTIRLSKEKNAINEYCGKKWPYWRAKLKRNYFNSPWAIISLIAAVLLLLLTITQTVFSILPNV